MKAEGWEGIRERDWRCQGKMDEAGGARPQERGRVSAEGRAGRRAGQAGGLAWERSRAWLWRRSREEARLSWAFRIFVGVEGCGAS